MTTVLVFLASLILLETGLYVLVNRLRNGFQWLITDRDESPAFDAAALEKFIRTSFDPDLGWTRPANSSGVEKSKEGLIEYHIDGKGARANPVPVVFDRIAAFGDSYTFCRQVGDSETWPAMLSTRLGFGVANFGVGNYGVDQAILRYERTDLTKSTEIVILGFVPETICRIQSVWKHYLEFGNTFAFKPRFDLVDGNLTLLENLVRCEADFKEIATKLPQIQKRDFFYNYKFRRMQFRRPYLLSFFRGPLLNTKLIGALLLRGICRCMGIRLRDCEERPFAMIMERNIREAHILYRTSSATDLLRALLLRFRETATGLGHHPIVLVMPQLLDLQFKCAGERAYQPFFKELATEVDVVDLTDHLGDVDFQSLYVEDRYGGHFSAVGNALVASVLEKRCRSILEYRNLDKRS